ncbi:rRNA small subunit methyltransferase H [Blastochloris viridis]|uniref:Ribosomal RNA small subunit methyltransferase H n=1 Tax=Blastochloris viridis TaxID=1079 RepID=A0A182CZ89_BLAVI|nr:rRNA small subunit methyltransferase H [Blastochloris viridis]
MLVREVVTALTPQAGDVIIDGTFGAGGYSRAILQSADCRVVAIDRDQSAILGGWELVNDAAGRLTLVEDRFSQLDAVAARVGHPKVDGVVLDIGVSSMQLDQAERGFSFRADAALDMRMSNDGDSAADVIAQLDETTLANVIYAFGEERHSRAVARAIVAARTEAPITTTRQLADIVARVVRSKPGDIHPATRTFQALRIAVNEELDELATALLAAERVLKPGGRLAVVTFHSLEDRIVKTFLTERSRTSAGGSRHRPETAVAPATFTPLSKKPVEPSEAEVAANPRARSAKLRAALRTLAPARDEPPAPGWVPDPFAGARRRR